MVESESSFKIIESKVFIIMLVFNFIEGLQSTVRVYLPVYFMRLGYSAPDFAYFNVFFIALSYIFSPLLFFIALYSICGGEKLLNRIASTLMSLIFGSIIGYWLGGIASIPFLLSFEAEGYLLTIGYSLPFIAIGGVLFGFAVLAFADINKRWRGALSIEKLQDQRPFGIVILSLIYIIFGILTTCIIPVLLSYSLMVQLFTEKFLLAMMLIVVVAISGVGQLLIGIGLYYGRKWGWFPALVSSVTNILISITNFIMFEKVSMWAILTSTISLVISVVILGYLLSSNVRLYFGLVNPLRPEESPPKS